MSVPALQVLSELQPATASDAHTLAAPRHTVQVCVNNLPAAGFSGGGFDCTEGEALLRHLRAAEPLLRP